MFLPTLVTFLPFSEGVGPRALGPTQKKNSIVLAADLPIDRRKD